MSEGPRKRVAGAQLSRDDDGEGRADDEFVTTPQVADESEMANRRVVRVRRPDGATSSANAFARGPSLFKDVSLGSDKEPPVFKMPFGAGDASKGTAAAFSFAAPASSSSKSSSSFGLPPTTKPSGFSFGGSTASPATTGTSTTPKTPFSFGGLPTDGSSATTGTTSSFSLGTNSAPSVTASTPAGGFSFGFAPANEVVEQSARDVLATAPSKLYLFEKGEGDTPGRWAERGAGEAKLIAEKKAEAGVHVHRLLVRGGYALNATVGKNLFTLSKTEAKHLILAVATSEGPHTYLLKFTGPNAEVNTTKFSEAIKKIMQDAEKAA
ncbi:NUP50 (Nucleoporin 50 kDa) family protein [Leishmania donovani]|nr:NUP50 (Nucleoporin 50 kDa) family protein [Leishmania donovani]